MNDTATPGATAPADAAVTVGTVLDALHDVIDPELGYNIVDLGLIYQVEIAARALKVRMTMTTPGCPAQDYIQQGVYRRAIELDGIDEVDIELVWEPPWSVQKMSDVAKQHFGVYDRNG